MLYLLAVETSVAAHDTTGGMLTKISEAAVIAKLGIDVYIVKVILYPKPQMVFVLYADVLVLRNLGWCIQAGTSHSLKAMSGKLRDNIPDDWQGTVIRFIR